MGKGRQIAAIILDNVARGRGRHIWFSISSDLREDAKRDLKDIGFSHIEVKNITKLDYGKLDKKGPKGIREGVVFATHAALVASALAFIAASRSACSSCPAILDHFDASLAAHDTVGVLSQNAPMCSCCKALSHSNTRYWSSRPAISKSLAEIVPFGLSCVTRSALTSSGHSTRQTTSSVCFVPDSHVEVCM